MVQNKLIKNFIEELNGLINTTHRREHRFDPSSQCIEETINYLRLSIKYLLFDLEACRRENADLLKMLNDKDDDLFC